MSNLPQQYYRDPETYKAFLGKRQSELESNVRMMKARGGNPKPYQELLAVVYAQQKAITAKESEGIGDPAKVYNASTRESELRARKDELESALQNGGHPDQTRLRKELFNVYSNLQKLNHYKLDKADLEKPITADVKNAPKSHPSDIRFFTPEQQENIKGTGKSAKPTKEAEWKKLQADIFADEDIPSDMAHMYTRNPKVRQQLFNSTDNAINPPQMYQKFREDISNAITFGINETSNAISKSVGLPGMTEEEGKRQGRFVENMLYLTPLAVGLVPADLGVMSEMYVEQGPVETFKQVTGGLVQSLNAFEKGIPAEERFARTMNALALVVGAGAAGKAKITKIQRNQLAKELAPRLGVSLDEARKLVAQAEAHAAANVAGQQAAIKAQGTKSYKRPTKADPLVEPDIALDPTPTRKKSATKVVPVQAKPAPVEVDPLGLGDADPVVAANREPEPTLHSETAIKSDIESDPLGLRNDPTIDPIIRKQIESEIEAARNELTGAGFDIDNLGNENLAVGRSVKNGNDLQNALEELFGLSRKEAQAVATIADARANTWAERTGRSAGEWYETRIAGIERLDVEGDPFFANKKAAVTFLGDGRAVIKALNAPDVSSAVHELGHIFRRDLDGLDLQVVERWAGAENGIWSVAAEEKFARGFEKYLKDGSAPSEALGRVFRQFASWLKQIYGRIKGNPVDVVNVSPAVRDVMDRLLVNEPARAPKAKPTDGSFAYPPIPDDVMVGAERGMLLGDLDRRGIDISELERLERSGETPERIQPSLFAERDTLFQIDDPELAKAIKNVIAGEMQPDAPKKFKAEVKANRAAETLTDYSLADLKKMELYRLPGKRVVYALKPVEQYWGTGQKAVEVVNVVSNEPNLPGIATPAAMLHAIERWNDMGGKNVVGDLVLDAFDVRAPGDTQGFLPNRYGRFGFEEVARFPYDVESYGEPSAALKDSWKQTGWEEGELYPDVVVMRFNEDRYDPTRVRADYHRKRGLQPRGTGADASRGIEGASGPDAAKVRGDGPGTVQRDGTSPEGLYGRGPERDNRAGVSGTSAAADQGRNSGQAPSTRESAKRRASYNGLYEELIGLDDDGLRNLGVEPERVRRYQGETDLYQDDAAAGGSSPKKMNAAEFAKQTSNLSTVVASEVAKGRTLRAVLMGMKKRFGLSDKQIDVLKGRHLELEATPRIIEAHKRGKGYRAISEMLGKDFDGIPQSRYEQLYIRARELADDPVAVYKTKDGAIKTPIGAGEVTIPADIVADLDKWAEVQRKAWKTESRVIEQTARSKKELYDWLITDREKAVTSETLERAHWRERMEKELPKSIIKSKKLSGLVMQFGEGKITLDDLKKIRPNDWQDIVAADKFFRSAYDDLLKRVNQTRERFGMKPIDRMDNYYTHFDKEASVWEKVLGNSDNRQGGVINEIFGSNATSISKGLRNTVNNRFAKRRRGDETHFDAVEAFERYLSPTLAQIHLTEAAIRRRTLARYIGKKTEEFRRLSDDTWTQAANNLDGLAEHLHDQANVLTGTRQKLDVEIAKVTGEGLPKAIAIISRATAKARIVGNVRTAVMQTAGLTLAVDKVGVVNLADGAMKNLIATVGKGADPLQKSLFMRRRYANTKSIRPSWVGDKLSMPMEFVEHTTAQVIWRGAFEQGISKNKLRGLGLSEADAIKYADKATERILAGRAKGEKPLIYETEAGRAALQFQLEPNNVLQYLGEDIKLTPDGKPQSKAMTAYKVGKLVAGAWVLNTMYENIFADQPIPDPIRMFGDVVEIFGADIDGGEKAGRAAGRVVGEALSSVPGGSTAAGFVMPEYNVLGTGLSRKDFLGRTEAGTFAGTMPWTSTVRDLWTDPAYTLLRDFVLPFGGGQIEKTTRGIDAVTDSSISENIPRDLPGGESLWNNLRSGTRDPKTGKKRYDVEGPFDFFRALAFGPSATGAAKEFYDKEREKELKPSRRSRTRKRETRKG